MPAYVCVDITITDPTKYDEYKLLAPASIAKYGGTYLTRGGATKTLEGTWSPKRFVILEFPTLEAAQHWWDSPEYAPAKALRQASADTNMVLVEGKAFDPNQALIRALSHSK
jgi:uncharacterized protein (DUF1330 family)